MSNIDFSKFPSYTPSGSRNKPEVLSISGGRTSAAVAIALINGGFGSKKSDFMSFQNTGKEDETCYIFLNDLQKHVPVPIIWLEYTNTARFISEVVWKTFSYDDFDNGLYTDIEQILDVRKLRTFDYKKAPSNFWYKDGYSDATKMFKTVNFKTASRNGKQKRQAVYRCFFIQVCFENYAG